MDTQRCPRLPRMSSFAKSACATACKAFKPFFRPGARSSGFATPIRPASAKSKSVRSCRPGCCLSSPTPPNWLYAGPATVRALFEKARRIAGDRFWCGHFHDTRGLALANVYAALQTGVTRFDATLAGIGGCPHAPGASGNASTEDLAFMLADMGIETGVDIPALLMLRKKVASWLEEETLHGTLWRAGLPKTFTGQPAHGALHASER